MVDQVVIGVDFGTLSGRALVVRVSDGAELSTAVHEYEHAVMARSLTADQDQPLPPDWALQVPADYVSVLKNAVPQALRSAGVSAEQVIGIGTDFTACTMVPTTSDGTPLNELPQYADRPHAYTKLWRHHAAQAQADRINTLAHERAEPWISRYGGFISSEWEFAKALQILEEDPEVYQAMDHWVEAADWIVWQLTDNYVRNACSAGYKGILQDGQYPSESFLRSLNPDFADFVSSKLDHQIGQLGHAAGTLSARAAQWTGLPEGIAVAVGNVDAHVTAPAADAVEDGQMVAIMGTSTCHVMNSSVLAEVPGMCGVVDGGILEGRWGYEAGQSGVGDILAWYVNHQVPGEYAQRAQERGLSLHELLTELAAEQAPGAHGLVALDWHSGNRSVLVDHELSGLLIGQTLSTTPEEIYRALIEATAFGTRTIIEAFNASGVEVREFVAAGGLLRNPVLMQIYADVIGLPISTIRSAQGPALGSAIHAAAAAGAYPDVRAAAAVMGGRIREAYTPNPHAQRIYDELFAEYTALHDYFGRGGNNVMRRLKALRRNSFASAGQDLDQDTDQDTGHDAGERAAQEGAAS